MTTLEEKLIQSATWLDRYNPTVQDEVNTKLALAQKKIIELISNTTNKATIKIEVNKIMQEAFSTFDTILIEDDIPSIQAVSWNATNAIMATYTADKGIKYVNAKKSITDKLKSPSNLVRGFTLEEHFKYLSTTTATTIRGHINTGFDEGLGIREINRNIRNDIGKVALANVNTIVRTSIMEATEATRTELYENYFKDAVVGYKYSAAMDSRTSKVCFTNNGIKHKKIKDFKVLPKNHYSCRSLLIPLTEFNEDEADILTQWDDSKIEPRLAKNEKYRIGNSKAIFDTKEEAIEWYGFRETKFKINKVKKIPANASPETYFKAFDKDYRIKYMGKARYELYESGQISFDKAMKLSRGNLIPLDKLKDNLNIN